MGSRGVDLWLSKYHWGLAPSQNSRAGVRGLGRSPWLLTRLDEIEVHVES